jgi:hypothetical protein
MHYCDIYIYSYDIIYEIIYDVIYDHLFFYHTIMIMDDISAISK